MILHRFVRGVLADSNISSAKRQDQRKLTSINLSIFDYRALCSLLKKSFFFNSEIPVSETAELIFIIFILYISNAYISELSVLQIFYVSKISTTEPALSSSFGVETDKSLSKNHDPDYALKFQIINYATNLKNNVLLNKMSL